MSKSLLEVPNPADHPYRIAPGTPVDLKSLPTRDESLFPVSKSEGKDLFDSLEDEIDELQTRLYAEGKHKLLVVFQAMDTGGKDGTIRAVFDKMDPQGIRVASFKRPSSRELAHDYLWRVHKETPGNGETVIFNRSHYEDITAVRVRDIYPEERWSKRYDHVRNFEQMLTDEGTTIIKIFLNISLDEQKARLQSRLDEPAKNWKFNPSDLEDRALWPKFMDAYNDVISRTSTETVPWYVIPADRKWYRNLAVAQIVIGTLRELNMQYPPVDFDPKSITID
ncbi:polyphosphate kinase 2 family protein [Verrucomicrobiales bacterium]|nr:polyphosphate kinase 2 family protein [Verrucomicrobiales bacterium]MDC0314478.1 polyphosphate kinase 2 family protein [bacterium]